jgi:hypothetical protein
MGDIDIDLARDRDKWRTFGFYKMRELMLHGDRCK